MWQATTGSRNVAVGKASLEAITTGSQNTAVGQKTGDALTTGNYNTYIGDQAGTSATTGSANVIVGHAAGYELTTGGTNVLIGASAGRTASPSGELTTESNRLVLGDNNITNSYVKVDWTVTSDRRDKTDIEDFKPGLSWITKLRPVTYRWDNRSFYEDGKPDGSKKQPELNVGLIAQEEIEVEKEHGYGDTPDNMLVSDVNADGNYGMQYSKLVPILINAVKELSEKVKALEGG